MKITMGNIRISKAKRYYSEFKNEYTIGYIDGMFVITDNEGIMTACMSIEQIELFFLKEAFKLQQWTKELEDPQTADPAVIDSLADFVVAFFGNKFTREELMDGAEMGEVMTIITRIVSKIKSPNSNPPKE